MSDPHSNNSNAIEQTSVTGPPDGEFVQLFTRHQRRLYLYILAQVPNPVDAEEILQETNLVIWRKCDQFASGSNFLAWSIRIARLEVLKHYDRRRRDRARFSGQAVELIAREAEDQADQRDERRQALLNCLGRLRPADRDLIRRRYAPGASGQSVAEELGRPVNSVYQSLGRIRRALLDCITRRLAEVR